MGAVRAAYTPVGAESELVLCAAREASVERRVPRAVVVDIGIDVHEGVALWDHQETALLIERHSNGGILLRTLGRIEGVRRIPHHLRQFLRTDADHTEVLIAVSAHAETTGRCKARRSSLMPQTCTGRCT